VIAKVHADTVKALAGADLRKRITEIGMVTVGNTPEEFTKDIKVESGRWAKIIKERNLQVK
jgi:tripartite-type tricarboxylate transporter receptor subunit TctC